MVEVIDTRNKMRLSYNQPPEEALVAAYEQTVRKNFQTWTYKKPEQYPITRTSHTLELGGLKVKVLAAA